MTAGMRSEHLRRANLGLVLRRVHEAPRTRSQLSDETGLTRSAIGSLVGRLGEAGLVIERSAGDPSGPGRPSPQVAGHPDRVVIAGELAADSVAAAAVALGGTVRAIRRLEGSQRDRRPADVVRTFARSVAALLDELPSGVTVVGVGVAVAGLVERPNGLVVVAPNLGWHHVALGTQLERRLAGFARLAGTLAAGPVAVANEADLGMLAECARGAGRGRRHVLFVSGEVGVGGGLLVDGVPVRGASGFAGELGHLPVDPTGRRCRCGARGCWETEVGEAALLARARQPLEVGRPGVAALAEAARAGDPVALGAWKETGRWLGLGLGGLVNVLNPETVVLGGFYADAFDLLEPTLTAELAARTLAASRAAVRVMPAALGPDAALIGAAELAFEATFADPLGSGVP